VSDTEALDDLQHLYKLFYDDLKVCGCGNPEEVYALVRDLLALAPFYQHPAEVAERIGVSAEDYASGGLGAYYMVLHALDAADLIEHGGGIGGSWLTHKGTRYLELMKRHEWEDLDDTDGYGSSVGYPHDGNGCLPGCRHHHDPATVNIGRADLEWVYDYARLFSVHEDSDAATNPSMIRVRDLLGLK
jgi:hypothetical protein